MNDPIRTTLTVNRPDPACRANLRLKSPSILNLMVWCELDRGHTDTHHMAHWLGDPKEAVYRWERT